MALKALRKLRTPFTPTATPTIGPALAPPPVTDGDPLLEAVGLTKSYAGADGDLPVLSGIDLTVRAGEIVALLGKSGSGKSTLLRCLAGLVPASSGSVAYRGEPLTGANPGTAMVFQTFALLPWLTVRQNVELGLEARGVPAFQELIDRVYRIMTGRPKEPRVPGRAEPVDLDKRTVAGTPLPAASVDGLSGLAELVAHRGGRCDLADLADGLGLDVDDLLPQVDALELLGFASVDGDDLILSEPGTAFAEADVQTSKTIFAAAAIEIPLVKLITNSLRQQPDGAVRAGFFRDLLAHHFTSEQAGRQLETATGWGRYAELYSYDADPQEYRLEE
ncbi:AAA-associated domain-containing protein [Streptomyces flavofungini]|uniref:AAA-associated domain-containing protein n=1 Tax=Streptomyces flavofungini TaxID=68200 RepID=UPI0025B2242A|nr:AAA-associated domain-containing protein [Streptomyces flavofungini]WJV50359.1 AAA-associated domain-containing protein [Streptomyces flavofungini]